jgi:hypothetical protein
MMSHALLHLTLLKLYKCIKNFSSMLVIRVPCMLLRDMERNSSLQRALAYFSYYCRPSAVANIDFIIDSAVQEPLNKLIQDTVNSTVDNLF